MHAEKLKELYDDSTSILQVLDAYGIKYTQKAGEYYATCANKDAHRAGDRHPSMRCNDQRGPGGLFICDVCGVSGNKFQLIALLEGMSTKDLWKTMKDSFRPRNPDPSKYETIYEYPSPSGILSRRKVRLKPFKNVKKPMQWESLINGKWMVTTGTGAPPWLFRMNKIAILPKGSEIVTAEGEKDVLTLMKYHDLGFEATCAPSSTWPKAYGKFIEGMKVTIFWDDDPAGVKYRDQQIECFEERKIPYRVCDLPKENGCNDISDLVEKLGPDKFKDIISQWWKSTPYISGGLVVGGHTVLEGMLQYREDLLSPGRLDLSLWDPELKDLVKPISKGSMVVVAGATAVGKTTLMQEFTVADDSVRVAFIEFELTWQELSARLWCTKYGDRFDEFEEILINSEPEQIVSVGMPGLENIRIFNTRDIGGRTAECVGKAVEHYEITTGYHPDMVVVDYLQLMQGRGGKKYDMVTDAVQSLRAAASSYQVIVIVGSQLNREASDSGKVGLHCLRDSGAIEESASHIFIGRKETKDDLSPEEQAEGVQPDASRIILEIVKNKGIKTKLRYQCDFSRFRIRPIGDYEHEEF